MPDVISSTFILFTVCGVPTMYFDDVHYNDKSSEYTLVALNNDPESAKIVMERMKFAQRLKQEILPYELTKVTGQACVNGNPKKADPPQIRT